MAVTRIKNNQITDATVVANAKLVDRSISSAKLANNLTYDSNLTITGNLTVQGTSTAIDTTITTIEDPIIVLASTQTSGAPAVDIGFLGFRGNSSNIAFVWDESAGSFVTAFTSTAESNTTITITSLANLQVGNLSLTGNTLGNLNVTGNIAGGNLLTPGLISATANVTGGNLLTGGLISATSTITSAANITGGNLLTGGLISATGTITSAANITGGNVLTGGVVSATANVTGGNLVTTGVTQTGTLNTTGNATVGGNLIVQGNITYINIDDLRVEDPIIILGTGPNGAPLTVNDGKDRGVFMEYFITAGNTLANAFMGYDNSTGNMILATTATIANDVVTVTAFGTLQAGNLNIQSALSSGNITGGNLLTGGLISATANVTGGNIQTGGVVTATGNVTGGNIVTGGLITATGNIVGANLILTSGTIDGPAAGRVTINASDIDTDFAVDGDTLANVFYVDAGTGTASFGASTQVTNAIVNFTTTNSIKVPVGNTAQRPATGVTGMMRFNTTTNSLEIFNNTEYTAVGVPSFTVIDDEQFNGDGTTVAFTLGSTQTTNSCIVSINGVVQVPTIAYSVAGTDPTCVLTFTEAPLSGDLIDVRQITTTTSVTSISNSPGNAVIATNATLGIIDITGDVVPTSNVTFDLGSANLRWNDLYLAGNSIVLGNTVIKNTSGNSIGFFGPDGTTAATIDAASVDTTTIANGTSNVKVVSANANVTVSVAGTSNVAVFSTGGITVGVGNVAVGNLVNNNANGVGNIGTTTTRFNQVFALASSAQYADLAEKYTADATYATGTVVAFGGAQEVTISAVDSDRRVAGVISALPSFRMNDALVSEHTAMVALTGRVPTLVTGPVRKGDMMVSAGAGRARAEANPAIGTVIGKALADHDGADGVIEVVVGRV